MTQEERQLLLADLCVRLPYGVKVCIKLPNHREKIFEEQIGDLKELTRYGGYLVNSKGIDYRSFNFDIKPYLRPMSSMTEEERKEFEDICTDIAKDRIHFVMDGSIDSNYMLEKFDWLNRNHFDYRGLIPMGLAIEVTEDNNPYENNN